MGCWKKMKTGRSLNCVHKGNHSPRGGVGMRRRKRRSMRRSLQMN